MVWSAAWQVPWPEHSGMPGHVVVRGGGVVDVAKWSALKVSVVNKMAREGGSKCIVGVRARSARAAPNRTERSPSPCAPPSCPPFSRTAHITKMTSFFGDYMSNFGVPIFSPFGFMHLSAENFQNFRETLSGATPLVTELCSMGREAGIDAARSFGARMLLWKTYLAHKYTVASTVRVRLVRSRARAALQAPHCRRRRKAATRRQSSLTRLRRDAQRYRMRRQPRQQQRRPKAKSKQQSRRRRSPRSGSEQGCVSILFQQKSQTIDTQPHTPAQFSLYTILTAFAPPLHTPSPSKVQTILRSDTARRPRTPCCPSHCPAGCR